MLSPVDFLLNRSMDTNRAPSPAIWGDCPVLEFIENPGKGTYFYEDFSGAPVLTTLTTVVDYFTRWRGFASTTSVDLIRGQIGSGASGLKIFETEDNEGASIQGSAVPFKIALGQSDLWYEIRLKTSVVANTESGFFVGLAEEATLSATVPIAAAGTMADINFVGFHRLEGDGDQIDTVYKADGQTQVTVKADAISTTANVHTAAGALAADTFIKLGMRYFPTGQYAGKLAFYINNVLLPDRVTLISTAGNPFPNDVNLAPIMGMLNASASDSTLTIDYVRIAQRAV